MYSFASLNLRHFFLILKKCLPILLWWDDALRLSTEKKYRYEAQSGSITFYRLGIYIYICHVGLLFGWTKFTRNLQKHVFLQLLLRWPSKEQFWSYTIKTLMHFCTYFGRVHTGNHWRKSSTMTVQPSKSCFRAYAPVLPSGSAGSLGKAVVVSFRTSHCLGGAFAVLSPF